MQVLCGGMGLQVFPKRGAPTTYIYQTLLGWMATDEGFEINTADGQTLLFECDSRDEGEDGGDAVPITDEVTRVVLARVVEFAEGNGHFVEK